MVGLAVVVHTSNPITQDTETEHGKFESSMDKNPASKQNKNRANGKAQLTCDFPFTQVLSLSLGNPHGGRSRLTPHKLSSDLHICVMWCVYIHTYDTHTYKMSKFSHRVVHVNSHMM